MVRIYYFVGKISQLNNMQYEIMSTKCGVVEKNKENWMLNGIREKQHTWMLASLVFSLSFSLCRSVAASRMGCCHIYEVNNAFEIGKFIVQLTERRRQRPTINNHTQACVKRDNSIVAIRLSFCRHRVWIYCIHITKRS